MGNKSSNNGIGCVSFFCGAADDSIYRAETDKRNHMELVVGAVTDIDICRCCRLIGCDCAYH